MTTKMSTTNTAYYYSWGPPSAPQV